MKKILIIRFSSIGDIVLTTPVVRCLKKHLDGAEIHFLTKTAFEGILKNNPFIDKVISLNADLNFTIGELKKENYDFVVDLHHNVRSLRVKMALGKPSASFNKLNLDKWLLVNLKINRMPSVHIVDRYMETVRQLNVQYDGRGLDYFIPSYDEIEVGSLPAPWNKGYIAMVIGAKHFTKKLPDFKLIELINLLRLPVVLIGGKEDIPSGRFVCEKTNGYSFDSSGKYNLNQSASLVEQAKLVITHDTGLMHIAAAKHQRIISIWGNTVPEFGMYPFLPEGRGGSLMVENKSLECRPCSKIGYNKCPKGHFNCMNELDLNRIVEQARHWWEKQVD